MSTFTDLLQSKFVIAGTGSRDFRIFPQAAINERLMDQLGGSKTKHGDELIVMSGGAGGWDHAVTLAAQYHSIPYVLCLPNQGYIKYYWKHNFTVAKSMMNGAAAIEYTMEDVWELEHQLYKDGIHSNFLRNQRMVDLADAFLVYKPASAGTKDCIKRIEKAGKPYKVLGE